MGWVAIITLTLEALSITWETLTAREAIVIRLEPVIYLWSAWYIWAHM